MKILYSILIVLISYTNIYAEQNIYLDNENLQTYKNIKGKWIHVNTKDSLLSLSKKYSCSINKIYSLNNSGKKFVNKYYFIPFTDEYIKNKNITRQIIISTEKEFIWPVEEVIKTTSVLGFRHGKFHPGVDLPAVRGKPVLASMEGVVIQCGYADGYGKIITIKHRDNFISRYAHNYMNLVKIGDFVKKGQIIALVGSTGHSTGNHLHFEIRCMNIPMDPLDFLPQKKDLHITHTLKNWK